MNKHRSSKVVNFIGRDVRIGRNVKIWHYAYVGDHTKIGDNVVIGSLAHVDYNVVIGSNTHIEGLAYIPPMSIIGNNVFIGPAATLTNDPYPPSNKMVGTIIEDGAILCAKSLIKAGVKVGKNSVVGMGALVTRDVPPGVVVVGIPARVLYSRRQYDSKRKNWQTLDNK
jgi:acetyltransferase-like isoleucine patch superfamily enzyme